MSTPNVQVDTLVWNRTLSVPDRELDHDSKLMPTRTGTIETKKIIFSINLEKESLDLQPPPDIHTAATATQP